MNGQTKVIGEFTCDYILRFCHMANADIAERPSCVRREEIFEYSCGKEVFGWHISYLKIYDKPKKLSEFRNPCKEYEKDHPQCGNCDFYHSMGEYPAECGCDGAKPLSRPPQSWFYVEEV